ncbi:MAG: C10 family peptidase [Bacteroidaceae bacterium]|nr:C10 family peptidase [Bacteroidaceae bacterium]
MRNFYFSFILLAFSSVASADVVDQLRAAKFVEESLSEIMADGARIHDMESVYKDGVMVYYIVNIEPEGWAIVSASDAVLPLLGYNNKGSLKSGDITEAMSEWLDSYAGQIKDAVQAKDKPLAKWENPRHSTIDTRGSSDIVSPIIEVNWNQGRPYNQFCPSDSRGVSVVGCVAVGMAQAMSAVRWPDRPVGQKSYYHSSYGTISINYDLEDAYDWDKIVNGDDNKVWVAHLLYHCGVSVNMDYSPDGSGTQTSLVASALQKYYSYPSSVKYYSRDNYSGNWVDLIISELKAGRPIIYSGSDSGGGYGHCFNIDGYDGNSMFHLNWGWGGYGDGYFTIDGLRDRHMNMNYDVHHGAVVGLRAPSATPTDFTLTNTEVELGSPRGTKVASVNVESDIPGRYMYTITGTYNIITKKYNPVPFEFDFSGDIVTSQAVTEAKEYKTLVTVTSSATKESLTKEFVLKVKSGTGLDVIKSIEPVSVSYYSLTGQKITDPELYSDRILIKVSVWPDGSSTTLKQLTK